MAKLIKRGLVWHFDFRFQRKRFQGSTFLKNREKAESFIAKFRADLALGLVGLAHRDPPPILSEFLNGKFLESVRQNARKPSTRLFYERCVKQLCKYPPYTHLRLDRIDELATQGFKDWRKGKLSVATVNGELRTLRKAMIFADTCGLTRYRRIRALPGENSRTFTLDGALEHRYLALAVYPLKQAAILMLDLGLRAGEAAALRKADITGHDVTVISGKTDKARRSLPQTHRTRGVFELCARLFPDSEWVFKGSKGKHFTRGALDNLHTALRDEHGLPGEFVLHSLRHTFATRLSEATGGDLFVLKEALGHTNTKTCERYVHTTAKHLGLAMKRKEMLDRLMRGEMEITEEITTAVPTTADSK